MSALGTTARMAIEPAQTRGDEKVHVRVLGLEPNQTVVLRARMRDDWSSWATFRADATGAVDVSSQPALSGTYQGIDQMGLFWSMVAQDELKAASFLFETPLTPTITTMSAEVAGEVVACATLERAHLAPGVRVIPVREQGLVGTLFRPDSDGPPAQGARWRVWLSADAQLRENEVRFSGPRVYSPPGAWCAKRDRRSSSSPSRRRHQGSWRRLRPSA